MAAAASGGTVRFCKLAVVSAGGGEGGAAAALPTADLRGSSVARAGVQHRDLGLMIPLERPDQRDELEIRVSRQVRALPPPTWAFFKFSIEAGFVFFVIGKGHAH